MKDLTAMRMMLIREIVRFTRKPNRTILPSIISAFLYIFAFGYALGSVIPPMGGVRYIEFMLPGIVLMQVIIHAYINPAYSIYSSREDKYIEDPLTTSMRYSSMVIAYVLGGMARGLFMGIIISATTMLLFGIPMYDVPLFMLFMIFTSATFACFGVMLGQWASNIEDVGNVMSYLLSPLLFLGGVFFSIDMVPGEIIRTLSYLDPLTYVVDGFRYSMIGVLRTDPYYCLLAIIICFLITLFLSLRLFKSGYHLKT
ncbi:sugar ABC transporter permease [Methanocella sp. CWC-04]|uniref:Sugar ABC transporter permease n=1 Tax=Methanooceanicella nereidis TaxID=2052831 RepID=A0AAP2RD40_9EURY|nr:sugar ABC transporter permease [Methanocella sp. CWC-04]